MQALLEAYRDRISAIKAVKEGLPVEVYMALKTEMGVSDKVLFQALKISERTIRRRKREGRFKRNESERIMRLVRLHDLAESVFEDPDNAVRWLQQKNVSLGMETPLEYADTELGGREVEELLYRIEYNLLSWNVHTLLAL
jgi:putative toxin-antitoxin system antitoxin component (TIGR02293 family)